MSTVMSGVHNALLRNVTGRRTSSIQTSITPMTPITYFAAGTVVCDSLCLARLPTYQHCGDLLQWTRTTLGHSLSCCL